MICHRLIRRGHLGSLLWPLLPPSALSSLLRPLSPPLCPSTIKLNFLLSALENVLTPSLLLSVHLPPPSWLLPALVFYCFLFFSPPLGLTHQKGIRAASTQQTKWSRVITEKHGGYCVTCDVTCLHSCVFILSLLWQLGSRVAQLQNIKYERRKTKKQLEVNYLDDDSPDGSMADICHYA